MRVAPSALAIVTAVGCGAGPVRSPRPVAIPAPAATRRTAIEPVAVESAGLELMADAPAIAPPAADASEAPVEAAPTRALLDEATAGLRRDARLDGIAGAAARAASKGYVIETAALRAATVAGLGSDVLPYVITARGEDDEADADLAEALGELRREAELEAVGLGIATGATGRVVALVATPVPTVAVTRLRIGDDVTVTLPWAWPVAPTAYLATPSRARHVAAVLDGSLLAVTVRCRGPRAAGFGSDAGLEIDAGRRLVASVPSVCGGRAPITASSDVGPPARTTIEIEQRLFDLVNRERADAGLPALTWDADAHRMARDHAVDMARAAFVGHIGSGGATLTDRVRGHALPADETFENVGRASGPGEAHAAFMASPGHRANLLAAGARRGAIGVALDPRVAGDFYVTEVLFDPAR